MKKFLVIVCLAVLGSCSNKYESVAESAPPPVLRFGRDTVLIREKDPNNVNANGMGMLLIYCSPVGHQFSISFTEPTGNIHILYRGQEIKSGEPLVVTEDPNQLYCYADAPGEYEVDFYLTDQLGRTTAKAMLIVCKPGEKPLAALRWQELSTANNNWEYEFDGSHSAQPFGQVTSYHYLIDSDRFETAYPVTKYIFHAAGQHTISFHVVDDLGLPSDTLTYTIPIQ